MTTLQQTVSNSDIVDYYVSQYETGLLAESEESSKRIKALKATLVAHEQNKLDAIKSWLAEVWPNAQFKQAHTDCKSSKSSDLVVEITASAPDSIKLYEDAGRYQGTYFIIAEIDGSYDQAIAQCNDDIRKEYEELTRINRDLQMIDTKARQVKAALVKKCLTELDGANRLDLLQLEEVKDLIK